jgi:hypothetical protein
MAISLEQIEKWAANPASIPGAGKYAEGRISNGYQALQSLKEMVKKGEITLTDYYNYAEPISKQVANIGYQLSSGGSRSANAASAAGYINFLNDGYAKNVNGQWQTLLPFTRTEYAKLPDNVLPTQSDINQGLFDPLLAPLQRLRQTAPTPQTNPGPGTPSTQPGVTPGATTPTNQTGTAPLFTANPNNPAPYGGLQSQNSEAAFDAQKIAQEAALQQQLAQQALEARATQRKKYMEDLSGILMNQQNQAFQESNPVIQEELNAKGLLRSSELGNALSRELKSLQGTTTSQLAKYGTDAEMADLNDLKGIQDSYNQARNSALQRQFSVEDYGRQIDASIRLGQEAGQLTPNQGKSGSPTTGAAIQGGSAIASAMITPF